METFMMLYVGLAARPSAEDQQTRDYNQQWSDYMGELARAGKLVSGAPFEPDGQRVQRDAVVPVESRGVDIGGYALVNADSPEAAVEIARRAPHIALGGTTIIRRCLSVPG